MSRASAFAQIAAAMRAAASPHSPAIAERLAAKLADPAASTGRSAALAAEYEYLLRSMVTYREQIALNRATIDSSNEGDLRKIAHRVGLELPKLFDDEAHRKETA